jgi:V8-like Glu-specific endopeptidase
MRSTLALATLLLWTWGCAPPPLDSSTVDEAIWNGDPTSDFPAVGALTADGGAFCTGALVDEVTVLTAAHCVDHILTSPGADVRFYTGAGGAEPLEGGIAVVDAESNPGWNGSNADIGLVYLEQAAEEVPQFVQVDEMPPGEWEGRFVTLVGYGITEDGLVDSGTKMKTEVQIYAFDEDVFFHYTVGTNGCFGDSGGPALYEQDGRWWVVGVLSALFGHRTEQVCVGGGGYEARPDVYADWISERADINVEPGGDDDDDDDDTMGDDDDTGSAGDDDDDDAALDDGAGGCQCSSTAPNQGLPLAGLPLIGWGLSRRRRTRSAGR